MRRAHNVPALVKAANLARWFPPWTVSREYWTNIMRSSVSGIAVDTLLFSRIGVPLFHRYQVQSTWYTCSFPGFVHATDSYVSGGI